MGEVATRARSRRKRRRRSRFAAASNVAGWLLFAALIAVMVAYRPVVLGGDYSVTIVSGDSMEPLLSHGDLIITKQRDRYEIGDVVVYEIPQSYGAAGGFNVVHRLIDKDENGWVSQGDNRDNRDRFRFDDSDVVGVKYATVSGVGNLMMQIGSVWVLAAIAAALAATIAWPSSRDDAGPDPDSGDICDHDGVSPGPVGESPGPDAVHPGPELDVTGT